MLDFKPWVLKPTVFIVGTDSIKTPIDRSHGHSDRTDDSVGIPVGILRIICHHYGHYCLDGYLAD